MIELCFGSFVWPLIRCVRTQRRARSETPGGDVKSRPCSPGVRSLSKLRLQEPRLGPRLDITCDRHPNLLQASLIGTNLVPCRCCCLRFRLSHIVTIACTRPLWLGHAFSICAICLDISVNSRIFGSAPLISKKTMASAMHACAGRAAKAAGWM